MSVRSNPTPGTGPGNGLPSGFARDVRLAAILALLGAGASYLSLNIPHTELYIEGRWIFGFLAFALVSRLWLALAVAAVLCTTGFHQVSLATAFGFNMLVAVPFGLALRWLHGRVLLRTDNLAAYAAGWFAAVVAGYQVITTPLYMAAVGYLQGALSREFVLDKWATQPFVEESFFVALISALILAAWRAQTGLARREEHLATILHSIGDAVIVTDRAGRVESMNPMAVDLTGWPVAEAAGRPLTEVFCIVNARTGESCDNPAAVVLATGQVVGLANHTMLVSRDGTEYQISDSGAPVRDPDGTITGVVLVFRDVTGEYHLREKSLESARRFQNIFENSPLGMIRFTSEGAIADCNDKFVELMGSSREKLIGFNTARESSPQMRLAVKKALAGEASVFEGEYTSVTGGRTTWLRVVFNPVNPDDVPTQVIATLEDISERKEHEEAVRHSKSLLEMAMANAHMGVWEWHLDSGRVDWLGEHACLFGIPLSEFGGTIEDVQSRVHPDDREQGMTAFRRVVQEGADFDNTYRVVWPDGSIRWLHSYGKLVRDEQGGARSILGTTTNVTARKSSEARIAREMAVNNAQADMARALISPEIDLSGLADVVHAHALAVTQSQYGYVSSIDPDTGENVGHTLSAMMLDGSCRIPGQSIAFTPGPGGFRGLYGRALNTGKGFYTNDPGAQPDSIGLPPGHVPIERLLTAPALYEGELVGQIALANAPHPYGDQDLEAVQSLADLFAMALYRIRAEDKILRAVEMSRAANLAKSEFLANMSHEIRTPLNGVLGMLQLVERTGLDYEQQAYVRNALESGRHLLGILSDILDLSRIESGKMVFLEEPFDLADVIEPMKGLFRLEAEAKGLEIETRIAPDVPSTLVGDAGRLRQILFNLVGNAVKYTESGSVNLEVCTLPRIGQGGGHTIHFLISDTGIGIPQDRLSSIFEAFTQAEVPYTKKYGGAGLGLAIVKRLVAAMGGDLSVFSQAGQGTEVLLGLPLTSARETLESPRTDDIQDDVLRGRVLVVEDERINLLTCLRFLEEYGLETVGARDGAQALETLSRDDFDIVLMDIQMPGMDGLEATRRIREGTVPGVDPGIPIVAMTAYAMAGDRERFLASGMDAYVAKPLELDELREVLAGILASRPPGKG